MLLEFADAIRSDKIFVETSEVVGIVITREGDRLVAAIEVTTGSIYTVIDDGTVVSKIERAKVIERRKPQSRRSL